MKTFFANNKGGNVKLKVLSACIGMLIITAAGCTNDKDIKAEINGLAKTDVSFAGVKYTVDGKVVTLTGNCPSQKAKDEVEKALKSIRVIKSVNNQVKIAPVVLDETFPVKQAIDSLLATYPTITADVSQGGVSLKGKIKKPELTKLLTAVYKLNPVKVDDSQVNVE